LDGVIRDVLEGEDDVHVGLLEEVGLPVAEDGEIDEEIE